LGIQLNYFVYRRNIMTIYWDLIGFQACNYRAFTAELSGSFGALECPVELEL
jgi:hypothetical protein